MIRGFVGVMLFFCLIVPASIIKAGGPINVNNFGVPFRWDSSKIVMFVPDQGSLGFLSNSTAVQMVNELFQVWEDIPTALIRFSQDGQLSDDITGSNVLNILNSMTSADSSPIIFDHDGSITELLAGQGASELTIGFAGSLIDDLSTGEFLLGYAVMNGRFLDGNSAPDDLALSDYRRTFIHEFGHFAGLAHSQINLDQFFSINPSGMPVMFPIVLNGLGEELLRDDIANFSNLYPDSSFKSQTATINGRVFLSNGVTQFQGANVIARNTSNLKVEAISSLSGFLHVDSADSNSSGSSDPQLLGFYEIPGLLPGDYIVSIEQIDPTFSEGSRVGALNFPVLLPGVPEFYNSGESNSDNECASVISITANQEVSDIDFIINRPGSAGFEISEQEPDNGLSTAQDVLLPVTILGEVSNNDSGEFTISNGDDLEDLYSFSITEPEFVSIYLSFENKSADLDLVLFNTSLEFFIASLNPVEGAAETIGPINLAPDNYIIAVSNVNRSTNPSSLYTLDVVGACSDEAVTNSTPLPTPAITPAPNSTPTNECLHDGDVNKDGVITVDDVLLAFDSIFDESIIDDCQAEHGDINNDGIITVDDVLCIFDTLIGNECQ